MNKILTLTLFSFLTQVSFAADISITMDDFNIQESTMLDARERNARILEALKGKKVQAALFVTAKFIKEQAGKDLLSDWDKHQHLIGNHTFNHLYFGSKMSVDAYKDEIVQCENSLNGYSNFKKLLRFPYLGEGDTAAKRDLLRSWLSQNGYKNGFVTIDASDWYIDQRMRDKLKIEPNFDLTKYREFYLEHMWERAQYYNDLSKKVLKREVKHTLLVHYNLLNALYLKDVMSMFQKRGWKLIDASEAFLDPAFNQSPKSMPSGQSLIWALAKETGKFEDQLRYPGEDGDYEKDKMDKLGL